MGLCVRLLAADALPAKDDLIFLVVACLPYLWLTIFSSLNILAKAKNCGASCLGK